MSTINVLSAKTAGTLLQELLGEQIILMDDHVTTMGTPETRKLRSFLIDNGYIAKKDLVSAVNKMLLAFGKKMHRVHTESMQDGRLTIFPDHLPSPHALGYAIKNGSVLPIQIKFDHGETAKEYMVKAEGLLDKVVAQLLMPYVPGAQKELAKNEHACCE